MTKIDIFSGFLGAGKTTLIKKLIQEAYKGEKVVLIENEFGEIGIDGGFLKEAGIEITEMNSGCICCSLVGDFGEALKKVLEDFAPDRILIEPSGVGKLSDVIKAVNSIDAHDAVLNGFTTVADAGKCKMYMKNFGEFYNDQIEHAGCIVLSHTQTVGEEKTKKSVDLIREHNKDAVIVTTPWDLLTGKQLLEAMERKSTLDSILDKLKDEQEDACPVCGHHHDHEHEHCHEHEHHHDHEHEHCHEHEHHHDHEHEHCHEHEHHHHHDEECTCGCHHDHHHHHADEVFVSWGVETTRKFTEEDIKNILNELQNEEEYGMVLRAKGIVDSGNDQWVHFDYVPGEIDVRTGGADIIGRICVIGSKINEEKISALFHIE
ncbi:MAG: GTP-binding protein [Clostridia bacterium]|nr:GTP-binding protein [Clostridia bacterium]